MKKTLALAALILCLCGLLCLTSFANDRDKDRDFRIALDTLDHYYYNLIDYIVESTSWEYEGTGENYDDPVIVPADEYEELVAKRFAIDDALIQELRTYDDDLLTYNPEDHTYVVRCAGGKGGLTRSRIYLGYVQVGEKYNVFYQHLTYDYLYNELPDGVIEEEYVDSLGWPEKLEYNGKIYSWGEEGYYRIGTYDNYGNMYTVEYNGDIVRIISCTEYTEKDLPSHLIVKNGLYEENGKLYFYENGKKASGWFEVEGVKYYASSATNVVINYNKKIQGKYYVWNDETGLEIADGFVTDENGTKCYEDGINVIGWRHADGSGPKVVNGISEQYSSNPEGLYYFLSTTGYMVTDATYKLGGYNREFNEDHTVKAMNGLQTNGGELYYYVDGVKQTGWQTIDGTTYYFRASDAVYGRAATKWMYIGNKVYYFYASTSATPYALKDSGAIGGITYTYSEDGYIIYNGFVNCDFANAANSNTAANIQKKNGTTRYYVDGEMQTGWQLVNGKWYYFYAIGSSMGSGYMCTESRKIGGVYYEFSEDGTCSNFVCTHKTSVTVSGYAPTCTENGLTDGKICELCKEVLVAQETIDALGHTPVTDPAVAPTCTQTGLTKGSHCQVCTEVFVAQETVPALGHTPVTDPAVAPECTKTGLTKGSHCQVCTEVLVAQEIVPALGHTPVTDPMVAPTCTKKGLTEGSHCQVCRAVLVAQKTVSALGHIEGEWEIVKEATKTEHGVMSLLCQRCDYSFKSKIIYAGSKGLSYSVNEDGTTCTITGIGTCEDTEIVIPQEIDGYVVTEIAERAFYARKEITSVKLPSTVTTIGIGAFNGCMGIEEVTLPYGLTTINSGAFSGCTSLKNLTIPDSVTYIGGTVLAGCGSLESLVLPFLGDEIKTPKDKYQYPFGYIFGSSSYEEGNATTQKFYGSLLSYTTESTYYIPKSLKTVTINGGYITYGAFYNCSGIEKIVIGNNVVTIEKLAFYSCSSLKELYVSENVTKIGENILSRCSHLETLVIPFVGESIKAPDSTYQYTFGYLFGKNPYNNSYSVAQAYYGSSSTSTTVDTYELPGTLKSVTVLGGNIPRGAFQNCKSLTYVKLPDDATYIGAYAFYLCSSLETLNIPNGVTGIGDYTFYITTKLTELVLPEGITSIGNSAFLYSHITKINIPDSVTIIMESAFERCEYLTEVVMGNGVTTIEKEAFAFCTSLKKLNLSNNLKTIGDYAFRDCYKITSLVVIPDSVTTINEYAFQNCINLYTVELGSGITNLDYSAFAGCTSLVEVYNLSQSTLDGFNGEWALVINTSKDIPSKVWIDKNGYAFYEDGNNCYLLGYTGNETELVLPASCNGKKYAINQYAFNSVKDGPITSIVIPRNVTAIGEYAFRNCTALVDVVISYGVTEIGNCAFLGCGSIKEIVIPDSVTTIGKEVFRGCFSLESMTIPFVGNVANPTGASSSTLFGYIFGSYSFTNSSAATQYYTSRFSTTYYLPCSLTSVTVTGGKIMYGAFSNCSYITSITLCEGVTEIGGEAFERTKITRIDLPESLTYIGAGAFYGTEITSIVIPGGVSVIDETFNGCTSLEYIKLCEGVTTIESLGPYTGFGENFVEIVIPVSVVEINGFAFNGCTVLENIIYNGTEEQWNSINKKSNWDYNTSDYTVIFLEK